MPTFSGVDVPQQLVKLDCVQVTTGFGSVLRQVVAVADPEFPNQIMRVNADGAVAITTASALEVTATTLPLPAGASTDTLQSTTNTLLDSIDDKVLTDAQLRASAVPVSASALPLPTGAATSANQTTGNDTLTEIQNRLPTVPPMTKQVSDPILATDDAVVANTVIHGLTTGGGGGYIDVKVTPSGALVTETTIQEPLQVHEYGIAVGLGEVADTTFVTLQGYNQATSTTNEPMWAQSGTTYPNVTAAQALTISSSSALDTAAGTGARTVAVTYIRFSDLAEVTAVFTLNGTTAVSISADGYAVNGIRVLTAGTGGRNAGILYVGYGTVTLGVPANILGTVVVGKNKAQQAIYTVPAGKTFNLMSYRFSALVPSFIQFRTKFTTSGIQVVEFDLPITGATAFNSVSTSPFAAGTQIQIWAQTQAGAGAAGALISGFLRSV